MIGMNTGNASAAESPFGGIKESGIGKESGKDVGKLLFPASLTETIKLTLCSCCRVLRFQDRYLDYRRPLLECGFGRIRPRFNVT